MKMISNILAFVLILAAGTSCVIGPTNGVLFTGNRFAGEFNPANDVKPEKVAKGCQHRALSLITWGKAGAGSIAKEAKISRIAIIDHSTHHFLYGILYSNYCTYVYGE